MTPKHPSEPQRSPGFRATAVRVLLVQVVTLALLGLLQAVYNASPQ